jgi:hypothetical protein
METREDILKELREIAPHLASLQKVNVFKVPESYFVDFKNIVLEQVKLVDVKQELQVLAPTLLKVQKPLQVEAPAAYFADFSSRLLNKVRADEVAKELATIAPRLSVLEKVNTLQAPANYFSAFPNRVLRDIQAQQKEVVVDGRSWVDSLNGFLDGVIGVVFKPKYSLAFAGMATMLIMGVLMFVKAEQCNDLECRFAQLSTNEINDYLDNKSDAYSDEVFEMNLDTKTMNENPNISNVHAYKDALKDVDDEALNAAIAD